MQEIIVENQLIFSKILNKINKLSINTQAYLLLHAQEDELENYAMLLAKVLICPYNYAKNCEKCNICKRITNQTFSELKIIKPEKNIIRKEKVIDLRNSFTTSSIEGKNQVYIIHGAEYLHPAAANSILKFLEEPESNTIAIFTTTNLDRVMNTILSRCQIIKLNNQKITKGMFYVEKFTTLDQEKIGIVMDYLFDIEEKKTKAITECKEKFLKQFNDREQLKSALNVILLIYKDALNYKLFDNMEYFNNEIGIKNIANSQNRDIITKKISFILENISKLEYNVNMILFINNLIIGIGEINNGKGSRY